MAEESGPVKGRPVVGSADVGVYPGGGEEQDNNGRAVVGSPVKGLVGFFVFVKMEGDVYNLSAGLRGEYEMYLQIVHRLAAPFLALRLMP